MKNNKKGLSLLLAASMLLLCGQPVAAAKEDAGLLPASEYALEEENVQGSAPEENVPAGIEWEETAPETTTGSASEENALEAPTGLVSEGTTPETVELSGEGLLVEENAGNEGAEPVEAATEAAELPVEGLLVEESPEDVSEAPEELTAEEETEEPPEETEVTEEALFEPEDETEEMTEATLTAAAGGSESAVTIAVNKEYTDYLTDPKDENWYRFTLPEDGYVTLTFSHKYFPDGSSYWRSYICDSNNMHYLFSSSFKGEITSDTTNKLGLPKGTHYLKVTASDECSISDYRVKINYTAVSFWETEHNGSSSLADPIAVNTVYTGSLWGSSEEDWYQFSLDSAGYIFLYFSHESITGYFGYYYWAIYLYDSKGKELVHYFTGSSDSLAGSYIGLPAGNYYLKVEAPDGLLGRFSNKEYHVRINYTRSAVWETEFNDASNTADQIAINTTYSGNIMHSYVAFEPHTNDVDWYRFTLASAGEQMLRFEHEYINSSSVYWQLTLYDSAMTKLETKLYVGNITSSMDWYHLSAGTYYIKIESGPYSSSTVDYRFRIGPHTHSYQTRLTKATLSTNGRSEQVCSCGDVRNSTTIYHPSSISLSATSYTYTGRAKKPSVTVRGSNGSLIAASNYTVSYPKGRANVGKYNVSITFKGNYSGTVSRSFTIYPAKTKLKKLSAKSKGFTVNWTKKTKQVSGYQIQYSLSSWFYSKKTKTVTKNTTTSLTLKGLKAKQRYYVRIRTYKTVSGKKYYSSWSSVKSVTTKK